MQLRCVLVKGYTAKSAKGKKRRRGEVLRRPAVSSQESFCEITQDKPNPCLT